MHKLKRKTVTVKDLLVKPGTYSSNMFINHGVYQHLKHCLLFLSSNLVIHKTLSKAVENQRKI
jgi:hypothetical protein